MRFIDREEVAVLAGDRVGRESEADITVYESLSHVVQDLASAWALFSGNT